MEIILSKNVEYAREAAMILGLDFALLDRHSGYLCEISDSRKRIYVGGGFMNSWPVNSASAYSLACDKPFCALVLESHGLRVPRGISVFLSDKYSALRAAGKEITDVSRSIEDLEWPLIAKPATGSRGEYVKYCGDLDELLAHFKIMSQKYDIGLIQEFVTGTEWRVVVFDGRVRWAYQKQKVRIIGDGKTLIYEFVRSLNKKLHRNGLGPIETDTSWFKNELDRLNLKLDSILPAGQTLDPDPRGNIAFGGNPEALTESPPEALADIALRATAAIGLEIAGIDIIVPEDDPPIVLEVNGNPSVSAGEKAGRRDLPIGLWRDVLAKVFDGS